MPGRARDSVTATFPVVHAHSVAAGLLESVTDSTAQLVDEAEHPGAGSAVSPR
jgi:hypothetical protein